MFKIANILQDVYNITPTKISLIKAGVENENYLVELLDNKYVLRIYNSSHSIRGSRSKAQIELELQFVESARLASIHAPHVIENLQNEQVSILQFDSKERFLVLFSFLEGTSLKRYSEKSAGELGKTVNRLFEVGKSFEECNLEMKNDIVTRSFERYRSFSNNNNDVPNEIKLLWAKISTEKNEIESQFFSKGLIHGDLKLENMFFDSQENLTAILDFDDYRYCYLIEESVMAIMHDLHSKEENLLRSGNYNNFIEQLKHPVLKKELQKIKYFLRVRLVYDLTKYLLKGKQNLVRELLEDSEIGSNILH